MRVILKVKEKGVIVLPKKLREVVGMDEGDTVVAETVGESIVLRVLKLFEVEIEPEIVDKIVEEEKRLEKERVRKLL